MAPQVVSGTVGPSERRGYLPTRIVRADQRPCWVVGCHGGAATTTLSQLVSCAADAGRYWPLPESGASSKVLLAARANISGLRSAQAVIRQWDQDGLKDRVEILGLVVTADAPGKIPRQLRDVLDMISTTVAALWYLPWIESLRTSEDFDPRDLSPAHRGFLTDMDLAWVDTLRTVVSSD